MGSDIETVRARNDSAVRPGGRPCFTVIGELRLGGSVTLRDVCRPVRGSRPELQSILRLDSRRSPSFLCETQTRYAEQKADVHQPKEANENPGPPYTIRPEQEHLQAPV